jgi:hypothetical protein
MKTRYTAALLAALFLLALPSAAPAEEPVKGEFVHHVFFWLKSPDNAADRDLFLKEIAKMKRIPTIIEVAIGQPAGTPRDVVDNSWTFDWLVTFKNKADWQVYNDHPLHLQFIKNASHLWNKVQVYDTIQER